MGDFEKENKMRMMNEEEEEEKERLLEGNNTAVLDFEMLCSTVALRAAQGKWGKLAVNEDDDDEDKDEEFGGGGGGVFRMWEGEILDCFDHHHQIALQSSCCPCYRFGKNMQRAGLGSCYVQAAVYLVLVMCWVVNLIAFAVTKRHWFLYVAVAFILSVGAYLGFFRTRIRNKFNIKGSDSSLDDCMYHFACPCCALSQESRTLEMNNVEDGIWHGRGDKICIGGYGFSEKINNKASFFELHPPPILSINKSSDPIK